MNFDSYTKDDDQELMAEINVTPLVDVMLVLLICFMITMPIIFTQMRLDFPQTASIKEISEDKKPDMIKLTVDKEANYYLEDKLIDKEKLRDIIKTQLAKQKDKKNLIIALNAEKDTRYEDILNLIELVQNEGITTIGYMQELKQ